MPHLASKPKFDAVKAANQQQAERLASRSEPADDKSGALLARELDPRTTPLAGFIERVDALCHDAFKPLLSHGFDHVVGGAVKRCGKLDGGPGKQLLQASPALGQAGLFEAASALPQQIKSVIPNFPARWELSPALQDLKGGTPGLVKGNQLAVQMERGGFQFGNSLRDLRESARVISTVARKQPNTASAFDGLHSVAVPFDLISPITTLRQSRHSPEEHRRNERDLGLAWLLNYIFH